MEEFRNRWSQRALSIVLIEDHPDSRDLLAESLIRRGHEVTTADNGEAGIDAITEHEPDAAIVDLGLPGIDGLEVARRARALLGPRLRLVALTGYGQPSDRQSAFAAGFDVHLTKPASLATVLRALLGA